jgi:RNA-directed DNA polymerase
VAPRKEIYSHRNTLTVNGLRHFPALPIAGSKAAARDQSIQKAHVVCNIVGGAISPLLANIALNVLDQFLEERGYRFVRYADDFVVLCRSQRQAEEALALIRPLLSDRLGLKLSPEKTKVTQFRKGFAFLGFDITSWSARMRAKSVENFKSKIRNVTPRSHNLDAEVIERLNAIIRGTANYFATEWSACGDAYRTLDRWIRMRLRCMKLKRKSCYDNRRLRLKHFRRLGLASLHDFIPCPQG